MYLALQAGYVGLKCNAFDLNSGGAQFKYRLGYRLSWQRFFHVFPQPLPANAAIVFQIRPRLPAS
jgi:hypothetical protein